jgi:hypothetical protein
MTVDGTKPSLRWWLWIGMGFTLVKLWLSRGQPVYAIGMAGHDERLFLTLAENIVQGNWLGSYDQMTLAKGPFYSIWVALVFLIGLPLNFAQQLAYAGACATVVGALAPALKSKSARLGVYLLLLWNPMSYEAPTLGRVLRQNIYTPLTLLIFAGLIALYYRKEDSFRRQAWWAGLFGFSLGAFWLTREESIWIVPSVVLLSVAALVGAARISSVALRTSVKSAAVATACMLLPILIVSWQNYRHYGWFGTVETQASAFKDAYGAMVRVHTSHLLPLVPVTHEAREAMYAVSPAFAKLRPHFEGPIGSGWAEASSYVTKRPAEEREIGGGWLIWALRDAVKEAGYAHSAGEAIAFYRQMADEINAACADGRLQAGPPRSGFLPPSHEGQTSEVVHTFWTFADFFITFKGFGVYPPPSIGGDDVLTLFRDMTGEQLSPSVDATNLPLPNQDVMGQRKLAALQSIGKFLRPSLLGLFCLTQLIAVLRVGQLIWSRKITYPMVLAAAAWGACFTYLLINAIIQVTSFPLIAVSSFAPAYPLLLLFIFSVIWDAAESWWPGGKT